MRIFHSESTDFKSLYHQAPCGLLTYKITGDIIHVNQTLLNWLAVSEAELVHTDFTSLLDRGGRLYYQLFVYPLLRMQQEAKEINFQIELGSKSFPCLYSAFATGSENGEEVLIHATIYKVADRKKYEIELLKKKVRAEEEKQRKAEALDRVAFYQSHMVRAPLANILGLISLLETDNCDEQLKEVVLLLKDSTEQLDEVIKKIVSKART